LTLIASILLLLLLVQGTLSLLGGIRFTRFVRRSLLNPLRGPTPPASVIAPIKGIDTGIEDNLGKLFAQDYPDYEIIFVIAEPDDPARSLIERAILQNPGRHAGLIMAPPETSRSQKVNNLVHGTASVRPESEILVFVDSDAQVSPYWLRALIDALADPAVGASTGYRWYLPATGGFWSALVSAWNGSILTTLGDHGRNFAWGGSAAINRDTFNRIRVTNHWDKALSDDYALTRAVKQAELRIAFVPRCLLLTWEDFRPGSAIEFTRRQITITRIYNPSAWWFGVISHLLFVLGFFGGAVWTIFKFTTGAVLSNVQPHSTSPTASTAAPFGVSHVPAYLMVSLLLIYALGCIKGWLRLTAATLMLPWARVELRRTRTMFYFLWPLVSLLFLYDFIVSATTRKIKWRGVWYEMRSPTETVVLDPPKQ